MAPPDKTIADIRAFWNDQARRHRTDLAATTPDPLAKDLEIAALLRHLDPVRDVLEVGCGNGVNILRLAEAFEGRLTGIDYAEDMIDAARAAAALDGNRARDRDRIHFAVGDLVKGLDRLGGFPQVFTDRCLINLPSLDLQIQALEHLAQVVVPGGRLVLIESVRQGQERLNALRQAVGLDPIPYHWHNLYLDEEAFLARVPASLRHVATDSFASLYFVASRVFNAKLTPEGETPDYLAEINRIAARLPSFGDHGPLKLFRFEKLA